jgi:hypothetical protein
VHVRTKLTIGAVIGSIVCLLWWRAQTKTPATPGGVRATSSSSAAPEEPTASAAPSASAETATASPAASDAADAATRVLATARWGSRRGELGHDRPQEGNAEGPMSFGVAGKDLVVVDQVNGRFVRYDASGRQVASSEIPNTVQDVAVASNGSLVLLDRLAGKTVTVTDANGHRLGELPLPGDPGTLTGVFVDGTDVYVEREHGALVRIGTTDGQPADEPRQLQGRPSKDGQLLLTATMSGARVVVNAFDRKKEALRFARAVEFASPSHGIVLLDTDARGTIYLGVGSGDPEVAQIACLDEIDGHVLGRVTLPTSHVPEESFRDYVVSPDGTIVYALRGDDGVEYRTARCP